MVKKISIIFSFIVLSLVPAIVGAANLYLSPSSGTYEVGQRVTVKVVASSDASLNAVSGILAVPSSIFTIESVSKSGSILNFWVNEPSFSGATGVVNFEGVALNGYTGNAGTVVSIVLKANKVGSGQISFQSGEILANDGQGTKITGSLSGGNFSVKPATVKPTPTPTPAPIATTTPPEPPKPVVKEEPKLVLNPPEIVQSTKYGLPAILGETDTIEKDVQAVISFIDSHGEKIFVSGEINDSGDFSFVIPNSLKSGNYEVLAYLVKGEVQSGESNKIDVKVGNWFNDISLWLKIVILLLLITISLLVIKLILKSRRVFKSGSTIDKEVKEAEFALHHSFDTLRTDITEEIRAFEKIKNERPLTDEEDRSLKKLKRDLDDFEKNISKEIDDIRSL